MITPCLQRPARRHARVAHAPFLCAWVTALIPALVLAQQASARADLIVTGARIYTVDAAHPRCRGAGDPRDAPVFVGSTAKPCPSPDRPPVWWTCTEPPVIPGMVDAHAHVLEMGQTLRQRRPSGRRVLRGGHARVAGARAAHRPAAGSAAGDGTRTCGRASGFHARSPVGRAPGDHPVALDRIDGHAMLANTRAMQRRTSIALHRTPWVARSLRDPSGQSHGCLRGQRRHRRSRGRGRRQRPRSWHRAPRRRAGVQPVGHHRRPRSGEGQRAIEQYDSLARTGALTLRGICHDQPTTARPSRPTSRKVPRARSTTAISWIRAVKLYADGALGSRGAALLAPYSRRSRQHRPPRLDARAPARRLDPGAPVRDSRSPRTPSGIAATGMRSMRTRRRSRSSPLRTIASASSMHRSSIRRTSRDSRSSASSRACRPSMRRVTCIGRRIVWGPHAYSGCLCMAVAAQHWRHHPGRQRHASRTGQSALLVSCGRDAPGRSGLATRRVVAGAANDARRSA